jgi:hypothetical protein
MSNRRSGEWRVYVKPLLLVVLLIAVIIAVSGCTGSTAVSINNTFQPKAFQLWGNLHTHTVKNATAGYGSDGAYNASYTLSRIYRDLAGEDFCAITDHYLFTPDPGVSGIIYIPGVEMMTKDGDMVALNISVAPKILPSDTWLKMRNATVEQPGIVMFAHSTMFQDEDAHSWTGDELCRYATNGSLIECCNSDVHCIDWADYDRLLRNGIRVWLTGVDDYHNSSDTSYSPYAWVVVNADARTNLSIIEALRSGNFYASNGGGIEHITVSNNTITIGVTRPATITWIKTGNVIVRKTTDVLSDSYTANGKECYIRIYICETENVKHEAWSQPMFIT